MTKTRDLADLGGGFIQAGATVDMQRTVESKLQDVVSVLDFIPPGTDTATTDCTSWIQAAINSLSISGGTLIVPPGTYRVNTKLNLVSNLTIIGSVGAVIKSYVNADYVISASNKQGIRIYDLCVEGNDANYSNIYFDSCSDVFIQGCKSTKAGAHGIYTLNTSFLRVDSCELSNNYYYGTEDKSGIRNKYTNNRFAENGTTGTATSAGGRGINVWMATDCLISGNSFISNTEYGSRIYSQTGDAINSSGNRIIGNYYRDNVRADLALYDETGGQVLDTIVDSCQIIRSTDTALGVVALLGGHRTKVSNCLIHKLGTFGTDQAYQFFNAENSSLVNCYAKNIQYGFTLGGSTGVLVDSFVGDGIAEASLNTSTDCTIQNSTFTHGGPGTTDICFNSSVSGGLHRFINNYLDGFYGGFYISTPAGTKLLNNETVNSGVYGIRVAPSAVVANLHIGGNKFDSAFIWEIQALSGSNTNYERHVTYYTTTPTNFTWSVGDICYNSSPSVGNPKGWVCTVAGTPGTWTSLGNL